MITYSKQSELADRLSGITGRLFLMNGYVFQHYLPFWVPISDYMVIIGGFLLTKMISLSSRKRILRWAMADSIS